MKPVPISDLVEAAYATASAVAYVADCLRLLGAHLADTSWWRPANCAAELAEHALAVLSPDDFPDPLAEAQASDCSPGASSRELLLPVPLQRHPSSHSVRRGA